MSMKWVIAFMIFATVFAIVTLIYVVVDILADLLKKKKDDGEDKKAVPVVVPVVAPVEEKKPEKVVVPVVIPVVDHIDADEADEMITDDEAMATVEREKGAGEGAQSYINLGVIDKNFEAGDTVTLAILKAKKLMPAKIKRIKILADGVLTKPITVKAESYSMQAIKMIELTGGKVVILEPVIDPNSKNKKKKKKR